MNDDQRSLFERLVASGQARDYVAGLTSEEAAHLRFDWRVFRRPAQEPPDWNWRVWLILAGRGFGKTRTGAEWIREQVRTGQAGRIALVGRTAADVRDTMIEGDSGILSITPDAERPTYIGSKRRLTWPNGAMAVAYSAEEPDRLRGPNHDLAWADEVAAWRYPDAWDQLMFGLRVGKNPRVVATTTPRPTALIKQLLDRHDVAVTTGSTYDNIGNLSQHFIQEMRDRYEGTRIGRQELHAELLADVEGALWKRATLDDTRTSRPPDMKRIVVAVDPAASAHGNETGIVVVGLGIDGHGYVLSDDTVQGSPHEWGTATIAAYYRHRADRVVAEANQGGDMVRHTLATVDDTVPIKMVTASRGKYARAEPIAAMYEQGKIHHVGMFHQLEDQMCEWVPSGPSPDRIDALVWGMTELMISGSRAAPVVVPASLEQVSPWRV